MPRRYTVAPTRRRSGPNYTQTRRQTGNTRQMRSSSARSATQMVKTPGGLKKINAKRAEIALPDVAIKKVLKFHGNGQYSAAGSTVWSHEEDLNLVPIGSDENTRESNRLRFLPTKFKLFIDQAATTEYDYRILVVKDFDMRNSSLKPNDIFANEAYWTTSVYKTMDDRADSERRFKVILDKSFRFNTAAPTPTRKAVKIKLPAANIHYDDDDTTGAQKKNGLWLFIRTNAPDTNASYNFDYMVYYKFLDQ